MLFKNQKGNIILEYLIYIIICIMIFQGIFNFLLISIKKNEMARITNFIAFSIAQDPKKIVIFEPSNSDSWMNVVSPNLDLDYSINCGISECSNKSSFVKVTLVSDFEFLMLKIPLKTSTQYQIGTFLSKN